MTQILNELERLIGRGISPPPRPEDFEKKADYIFAKTIHKRFPNQLNEPCKNLHGVQKELADLWKWADGEQGIGKIKPEYKFLTMEESEKTRLELYSKAPLTWLHDLYPIFLAPNGYYICLKESNKSILAVNLTDGKVFLLSNSMEGYIRFLVECHKYGVFAKNKIHSSDPILYSNKELEIVKLVGLDRYHPVTKDSTTDLSYYIK